MNGRRPSGYRIRLTASFDHFFNLFGDPPAGLFLGAMADSFIPLEPGEPVGVVALSGPVDLRKVRQGVAVLEQWGHPVIEAANLGARSDYLAGTDVQRLAGLEQVLDSGARVLVAARGGYGSTRLLSDLPWQRLVDAGAMFVGYSDLTAVLNSVMAAGGRAQVHGPMVAAGLRRPGNAARLQRLLSGELYGRVLFRFGSPSVARHGRAVGASFGFNLSMLVALIGTPFEPDLEGAVVFLEEVGEPLYRLDRMLTHLGSSGRFRGVKAILSGGLHGCRPAAGRDVLWRRLLLEAAPSDAAVVTGLSFGHGATNLAFPIGVPVEVDTRAGRVVWSP